MTRVALIEAKPSRNNYKSLFKDSFEFDHFKLTDNPDISKVLAKDVTLSVDLTSYDWVVLVGSEPLKYFTKVTSVTDYNGRLLDDKFLPVINPAMLTFKPEAKKSWEEARDTIIGYITGEIKAAVISDEDFIGIQDLKVAKQYVQDALDWPDNKVAIDTETTALYPIEGYILGISISYRVGKAAYIDTSIIDEELEQLFQQLFNKKKVIFHNSKFDLAMLEYHFNFKFPNYEDTMLLHYILDETPGTHGLKELALRFSPWGDYERPMYEWIDQYKKEHGVTKDEFQWECIPFDVIRTYAAMDANVTLFLYEKFLPLVEKNARLAGAYRNILLPAVRLLVDMQTHGVPFDKGRLLKCQQLLDNEIMEAKQGLRQFPEVQRFEAFQGKELNANSVIQLRSLFFDYLGLKPTGKKTEKGENSTDASVLEILSEQHPIPKYVLDIRQKIKIKSTYIDKILLGIDPDNRLRTGFHTHVTTSGRLSSSGKLNMQQLPRDNPLPKGCIKAPPGYKIVSMDLKTAEIYVAAILAGDTKLQEAFLSGENFHSYIAKLVFNLKCPVGEVEVLFPDLRQAAKAISFGILYGAGPDKIAEEVNKNGGNLSKRDAARIIEDYFDTFKQLKKWIKKNEEFIKNNAFTYSHFGRKRRLPDVRSDNPGSRAHCVRSGLNFLVQSPASDINLLGAMEANAEIKRLGMDAKIFALVHDSILATVSEDRIEDYKALILKFVQKDRGLTIPGCPIGCSFEVGDDYSFGKFEKFLDAA